jgi:hypothetical protein
VDIKKLRPEAEVIYELETSGEPISIKFLVNFISLDAVQDYVNESMDAEHCIDKPRPRISDVIRRAVADAIHGWDLTEGGVPLPCMRENKDKYLPLLFGLKIKQPEVIIDGEPVPTDPVTSVLVRALAEYAGNPENFLKN